MHLLPPPFPFEESFPASGSFPMNQLFASCGENIGASASATVFPMNIQYWFPLGLTCLISLLSKGFSRVFSSTMIWKHQFSGAQPSLWSNFTIIFSHLLCFLFILLMVSFAMQMLFSLMYSGLVLLLLPWLLGVNSKEIITKTCAEVLATYFF